jgi:hypothetical protein
MRRAMLLRTNWQSRGKAKTFMRAARHYFLTTRIGSSHAGSPSLSERVQALHTSQS